MTKIVDAEGNTTTYTYDKLDRLTAVKDSRGNTTSYEYDAEGAITKVTDPEGYFASRSYDALGRLVSETDRNGNTQSFTYDAKGQITKVTDKNGNETKYTYDGNGNILKTTDALGTDVLFEYNANGQLIKMTQNRVDGIHEQAETLVTLYEYDGRNLVTKVVRADSQELYTYDGNGNMISKTDGDGYVTEYSYNSLDLVSNINYNGTKEVSYQYDKVGNLVKMDDWLGTTTFEVDLLGQLTQMTDHKGQVVSYEYDAVGNQTSVTYPDETTVTKTYDETYNLTKVTDAEKQNYLYQYDDAGRVTKLTYPNGWVEDYTYDAEGNLLKTVDTDPFHNNKVSTKFEYRYDAEGNLISEYKRDTTAGNKALTTTYAYDALNRLVSAHEEGVGLNTTRTYDYDTLGNLIRQEEDGCIEYKYNGYALDESTKCGTIPNSIGTSYWEYTYDKRGNLISNDKYTRTTSGMAWQNEESFVYDETGRMVQGTNEQGELSLYTYNGLGIRVGRELIMKDNTHGYTDFHSQTPSVETGIDKPEVVKESYVIDYTSATFQTLVMEEEGGFDYRWVYGLERLSVKITSEGTNWWGQHVTEDILKDYLHQDRLGSTVNLSDQFGRVVGRADYNEWGEITYREALSISSSYRRIYPQLNYTGYDWDDVLGMYYAKARFYSADDKRFVAMDPIKGSVVDPLSLVSYLYCVDNPLRYVDPDGEFFTAITGAIGAAVGAVAGAASAVVKAVQNKEKIDPKKVLSAGAKGAVVGGVIGLTAGAAATVAAGAIGATALTGASVASTAGVVAASKTAAAAAVSATVLASSSAGRDIGTTGKVNVKKTLAYATLGVVAAPAAVAFAETAATLSTAVTAGSALKAVVETVKNNPVGTTNTVMTGTTTAVSYVTAANAIEHEDYLGAVPNMLMGSVYGQAYTESSASFNAALENNIAVANSQAEAYQQQFECPDAVGSNSDSKKEPGYWSEENEGMKENSRQYQEKVTGRTGQAYRVNGVKFDGYEDGILIEAKGRYSQFLLPDGSFKPFWTKGIQGLLDQARRQLAAAQGTPIVWYFQEEAVRDAVEILFAKNNIWGITLIYKP